MTQQSGVVSVAIPGVTSDTLTPGGEVIAGALTAGDPAAASVPSLHFINGALLFMDSPGNQIDQDDNFAIHQSSPLVGDNPTAALRLQRDAPLNGHQFTQPVFTVDDNTATTAPVVIFGKQGQQQLQVDGDGVRVHGKLKSGASVTHTLGAYSGKSIPWYDEAGTLLGYQPLYA